jgi:hypothetical protein
MENLNPIPINYLVILLVEILVYSIFVYFVFSKTTGETSRRWKASVVVAVIIGACIHISFIGLGVVGWIMALRLPTSFQALIQFSI